MEDFKKMVMPILQADIAAFESTMSGLVLIKEAIFKGLSALWWRGGVGISENFYGLLSC